MGVIGGLIAMWVLGAVICGGAVLLFGLSGAGVSGLLSAVAGASFPSPPRKLVEVDEGASHMSMYDNPDHLRIVGRACADVAREHF